MTSEPAAMTGRNQAYDLLRILAICAVVAIHVFGPTAANAELSGSTDGWVARILAVGSIWSVPLFVMLSGALTLSERAHRDGPSAFYARRARRVVPALIVWTFVYLVLIRMLVLDEPMYGWKIVTILVDGSAYPHLYFLWLIAGLYLVAPVLHAFLVSGGVRRAVVLAAAVLGFTLLLFMLPGLLSLGGIDRPIQLGALTFWLAYVGYFLVGHLVSRLTIARGWAIAATLAVPCLAALTIVQSAYPQHFRLLSALSPVEYLGSVVALLAIALLVSGSFFLGRLTFKPRLQRFVLTISEASFGVFLVHLVVLLVPYALLPGFHEHLSALEAGVAYVTVLVVSFATSILARRVPGLRLIF